MKKLFAIFLAISVIPTFHAHAWVGGPFDNNSYSPNGDDGIYEAVATVANGTGMYRWGIGNRDPGRQFTDGRTGNTSNVQFGAFSGAANVNVWYYQGEVYYGMCFGTVNSAIDEIRCIGNASTSVPTGGNQTQGITIANALATTQVSQTPIFNGNPPVQTGVTTTLINIPATGAFANSMFTAEMGRDKNGFSRRQPWSREFFGTGTLQVSGLNVFGGNVPAGAIQTQLPITVFGSRVSMQRTG